MREMIGRNLRVYRNLANLTQKQFAEAVGVTNRVVSNWETGVNGIDVEMISTICKVLDISADVLLDVSGNKPISDDALTLAYKYDRLDDQSKALVRMIVDHEAKRPPIPKGALVRMNDVSKKEELHVIEQPGLQYMENEGQRGMESSPSASEDSKHKS